MSSVLRRKLVTVAAVAAILTTLGIIAGIMIGAPMDVTLVGAPLISLFIATFEEFYVQGLAGTWMRRIRPILYIPIYAAVLCVILVFGQHIAHLVTGRLAELSAAYSRFSLTIPLLFIIASFGVLSLRVVGYIGAKNLWNLLIGRYLRPIVERKVFLFLDLKGSTEAVAELGQIRAKAYIGKFLFDISRPISEHRGDIYLYTGDGLIGMWDWRDAVEDNRIVHAVDAIYAVIDREREAYLRDFERVPEFRIGVHGGDVVISEQGDTKRAIGVYGDNINIAARMEQTAKARGDNCVFSADVVSALIGQVPGFSQAGEETVKGISIPISIFTYAPRGKVTDDRTTS